MFCPAWTHGENARHIKPITLSLLGYTYYTYYLVSAMSPFNQPIVLLSPGLLALGNCPPASRTLRHAAVRSVAPATPYLHNASSCVN
jgi:hypothetical protein